MTQSLDALRRDAKMLMRAHRAGDPGARDRVAGEIRLDGDIAHADALHVIAREQGFVSWPALTQAVGKHGLDRAKVVQRFKIAVFNGQTGRVLEALKSDPTLAEGEFALQVALLDQAAVARGLADDPGQVTAKFGLRRPMCHLAFSRMIQVWPEKQADMLAIAQMLVDHGADVNDAWTMPGDGHPLSALYGAVAVADNLALGRWLLDRGANPNDGESLYHATELGHRDGLRLLLNHGADPRGTNALGRAMDFDDVDAVRLLLDHGADPDEPGRTPALHHAARRMCSLPMIELLLDRGANPAAEFEGLTAYASARVFGNPPLARAIEARGADTALSSLESILARAADGQAQPGTYVDPATLPEACENMIRMNLHLPGKLDHVKALVALGLPFDQPDWQGLTPVQLAGWEGLPDVLAYFLSLGPDLSHVNKYGGTVLGSIVNGSENAPHRDNRDHLACLRIVLEHGVALPRRQIGFAGRKDVHDFLTDWAKAHPGQVI